MQIYKKISTINLRLFKKTLLYFLLLPLVANATLTARVDRLQVVLGESLTLEVTTEKNLTDQPDFSHLNALFHVGQTSRSSSTQIINGEMSSKTTWQVLLVAKSLGTHIITPIELDGEKTQPIRVTVKKPDPNAKANGDVFIELIPNKTEAYVQEEILLTVRLLYAINLRNGSLGEPMAEGVIFQQINKGNTYTTQRDGRTYNVLERKYALFSENSGIIQLNPVVFEGEITDNRRQSFSMFQRGKPVRQVSKALKLKIKQIPQSFVDKPWIPADQVVLKQNWSNNKPYKVGEPITRTIELVIAGLSETQLPELEISDFTGAKIYQDKTDTMTRTDGERLIATKIIKYAVIPTKQGTLTIPEFKLDWYDVKNKTLRTASIASSALQIEAADQSASSTPIFTDNKQVLIPETDMTKNSDTQVLEPENFLWKYLTWLFASLWLLTLVIYSKQAKKPTKAKQSVKEKTLHLSNKMLLRELKSGDAKTIQQALVKWWNLNNSKTVNNLSQIITQIEPAETKMLLDQLQQSLYNQNEPNRQNTNWPKIISNNGFKPKTAKSKSKKQGLPELYS